MKSAKLPGPDVDPQNITNPYLYPTGIWAVRAGSGGRQLLTVLWIQCSLSVISSEVGGKYRNIGKCKEIADLAVEKLRAGVDLATVKSMCVA